MECLNRGLRVKIQPDVPSPAAAANEGAWCAVWRLILFVMGMMTMEAMALVAALLAPEKLGPRPVWVARFLGIAAILAGVTLLYLAVPHKVEETHPASFLESSGRSPSWLQRFA